MNLISYKFYTLRRFFEERGIKFTIKRIIIFLFRPFVGLIQRNRILLELWCGQIPNLKQKLFFFKKNPEILKLPKNELVQEVRKFWYSNIPGEFDLDGEKIIRKDIFVYGGPNPKFTCSLCQRSEWLSRIRQKNLFSTHKCAQSKECEELCKRQGDELWTHFHQNFDFSIGCDVNLPAPRGLFIMPQDKNSESGGFYQQFQTPCCGQWMLVFRRRLAFACQVDVVPDYSSGINRDNYDFVFMPNTGSNEKFPRPHIPVIMYGHDFWPLQNKGFQWVIDWLKPDVFLTPYPTQWKEYYKLPPQTKVVFYPFFDSSFFARPNLNEKKLDLLVIGAIASSIYKPRVSLDKQIFPLSNKYKIEFSHRVGVLSGVWQREVYYIDSITKSPVYYLNKWSEYLGSAKYVVFGKMKYPVLGSKYYEVLGSGAIPIFPEVPDLKFLEIKPFEHYIPLSEIEGNNQRLAYYLDNYEKYKYIAENAVKWYKNMSDKMIFNDFEEIIREITNYRYHKRLI